jgi:hypothetical protein
MDMFRLYYYASIPLATNLIFYSITSLSTSISSSQNVVKFITEHKDCDSVIFKNEIADMDLENKLRIVESLVYDIIRKFSLNKEEFERTKKEIQHPDTTIKESNDFEFELIEIKTQTTVLERIDEPLKIALISSAETLHNIHEVLVEIRKKIDTHSKSYIKSFISLSLKQELSRLNKQTKILDTRTHMLFELLKIYLPFVKKRK